MERRTFLVWIASGAAAACVPAPRETRGRGTDAAIESDAAVEADAAVNADAAVAEADASVAEEDAAMEADATSSEPDATEPLADAAESSDAGCSQYATMHDTHAQALYFDGTYGPLTGVITVDQVLADQDVDFEFWHGHDGLTHHFLVTREHFAALKRGERVSIETTEVDAHQHLLFIDPRDENYRASGAPDVMVPLC